MEPVVGIFPSRALAEKAAGLLRSQGFGPDRVELLLPGAAAARVEKEVPVDDAEQPGVGQALGAVVGGAAGASAGLGLGAAVASLFVPGVGVVTAVGFAVAALVGAAGAVGGAVAGQALEDKSRSGIPHDELYLYEDALARGHAVVFAMAESEAEKEAARTLLLAGGAEPLDAARHSWWIGIRDAEKLHYEATEGKFEPAEATYRKGFQTALRPDMRGLSYAEAIRRLGEDPSDLAARDGFRRGFERGTERAKQRETAALQPVR